MFYNCKYFIVKKGLYSNKEPLEYEEVFCKDPIVDETIRMKIPDAAVCIDIDDLESALIAIRILKDYNIRHYRMRTDRGYHFYFANPKNIKKNVSTEDDKNTLIGLKKIDIQSGCSNQQVDVVRNGKYREWEIIPTDKIFKIEDLDNVPEWIIPYKGLTTGKLLGLEEGGGRNNALFNARFSMARIKLSKEEAFKLSKLINNYIFAQPLPDDEFDTVCRDNISNSSNITQKKPSDYSLNDVADACYKHFNIYIEDFGPNNKTVYFYNGKYYEVYSAEFKDFVRNLKPDFRIGEYKEILDRLKSPKYVPLIKVEEIDNACVFNNCTVIISKKGEIKTVDNSPRYFIKRYINKDYKVCECKECDDYINNVIGNISKTQPIVVCSFLGYTIMASKSYYKKILIVKGSNDCGKSTFFSTFFVKAIGDCNVSHVGLDNFNNSGSRFIFNETAGKIVNIDDEGKATTISNLALDMLKLTASGDGKLVYDVKFEPSYTTYCTFKSIILQNYYLKMENPKKEVLRKFIVINFNNFFPVYNAEIDEKVSSIEWQEYLIYKSINEYANLIKNGGIFKLDKYMRDNYLEFICSIDETKIWIYDTFIKNGKDLHEDTMWNLYHSDTTFKGRKLDEDTFKNELKDLIAFIKIIDKELEV